MKTIDALILAAGKGTRMRSQGPKVLNTLLGETMLCHVIGAINALPWISVIRVVAGHQAPLVIEEAARLSSRFSRDISCIEQKEQKGTGHALMTAMPRLSGSDGVLVVNGDAPLIEAQMLDSFLARADGADIAFLTLDLADAGAYGRVVRRNGHVAAIVEAKDYDPAIYGPLEDAHEVNAGIYLFSLSAAEKLLPCLSCANKSGEYYITDMIALGKKEGMDVRGIPVGDMETEPESLLGVNTPLELSNAESILRARVAEHLIQQGVIIHYPENARISPFADIAPGAELFGPIEIYGDSHVREGALIRSHCVIRNSSIDVGAEIREFSHLEGAQVHTGAIVGPFARLRTGTILEENVHVGDFVELKKTRLGKGSKANHLAYLGDCEVGSGVNIGAGTITCNYDGKNKYQTRICDGSFIGSNASIVAPVTIGEGSLIGAGSVITKNVPDGSLGIGRTRQVNLPRRKK